MEDIEIELMQFFKGLSDGTRLQIAGRLAGANLTAEQLADALGEKLSAVTHHLGRLADASLVEGPLGETQTYRLRLDHIHALAGRLLARAQTVVPEGVASDEYEHRVLRDFLRPDGSIRNLPRQEKQFMVIVRYAWRQFASGQRYSETEVNTRLKRLFPDSATLRRAMVDSGLLQRTAVPGTMSEYWRE